MGACWRRKGVREDFMKAFRELERNLCKRRKGGELEPERNRNDFMKGFEKLGRSLCKRRQGGELEAERS